MKYQKLGLGLTSVSLLAVLTGCGFKLDESMLSKDDGIWKITQGDKTIVCQFSKGGTAKEAETSDALNMETTHYTISKTDDGFDLNLGTMTISVPKKDQKEDQFTGKAYGEKVTFVREDKEYLKGLEKSQQEREKKEAEEKKKQEEQEKKERDAVFAKVAKSLTASGDNGQGSIKTDDIDLTKFTSDNNFDSSDITYSIKNDGHLKNGEKTTFTVNQNGEEIYQTEITVSGLTEYAKKASDVKNLDELKKALLKEARENSSDVVKQAYFYYPSTGEFSLLYENQSEFLGDKQIDIKGVKTEELSIDENGKVKIPDTRSIGYEDVSEYNLDAGSAEVDEKWNDAVAKLKRNGAEEIK